MIKQELMYRRQQRQRLISSLATKSSLKCGHDWPIVDNNSINHYMRVHCPISKRYHRTNVQIGDGLLDLNASGTLQDFGPLPNGPADSSLAGRSTDTQRGALESSLLSTSQQSSHNQTRTPLVNQRNARQKASNSLASELPSVWSNLNLNRPNQS